MRYVFLGVFIYVSNFGHGGMINDIEEKRRFLYKYYVYGKATKGKITHRQMSTECQYNKFIIYYHTTCTYVRI